MTMKSNQEIQLDAMNAVIELCTKRGPNDVRIKAEINLHHFEIFLYFSDCV